MKYSDKTLVKLVEFGDFTRFAANHLNVDEPDDLKSFLSANPEEGAIIQGTGGVRVIYYYHNQDLPLVLLNDFAKSEMENIGNAARNAYQRLVPLLVQHYLSGGEK